MAERFSDDPPANTILTWDNHCWVRLRSTMGLLEQQIARIKRAFAGKEGLHSYDDLERDPPSYEFADPAAAGAMLDALDALAASWSQKAPALSTGTPRPSPELRILPRV